MNAEAEQNAGAGKRLLVVLLILSLITLIYLVTDDLADGSAVPAPSTVVTVSVVVLAVIKVRIIFREFMEVRMAPALLGRLTDIAVVLIGVGVLGSYFLGLAMR